MYDHPWREMERSGGRVLIASIVYPSQNKPDVSRLEAGNRLSASERMKETILENEVMK